MCVSQDLNKITLLLVSPQPECVFLFFVSFIQNVQDPNKLYFLNLPPFCSVSLLHQRREGGDWEGKTGGPPAGFSPRQWTCPGTRPWVGVGGHFQKEESPVLSHCPEVPLRTSVIMRFWPRLPLPVAGPAPCQRSARPLPCRVKPAPGRAHAVQKEGRPSSPGAHTGPGREGRGSCRNGGGRDRKGAAGSGRRRCLWVTGHHLGSVPSTVSPGKGLCLTQPAAWASPHTRGHSSCPQEAPAGSDLGHQVRTFENLHHNPTCATGTPGTFAQSSVSSRRKKNSTS